MQNNKTSLLLLCFDCVARPKYAAVCFVLQNLWYFWASAYARLYLFDRLEKQNLLEEIEGLQGKENREFAKSVLEAGLEANKQIVKNLIGDGSMSGELLEILKPIAESQIKKDIRIMIDTFRELGHQDSKI